MHTGERPWWKEPDGVPPMWERNRRRLWWLSATILVCWPALGFLFWTEGYQVGFPFWSTFVIAAPLAIRHSLRRDGS